MTRKLVAWRWRRLGGLGEWNYSAEDPRAMIFCRDAEPLYVEAPADCDPKATSLEPGASERDANKGAGSTPDETPGSDEVLAALDWNRLRQGAYRALDPENQFAFDFFRAHAQAPDETLREALAEMLAIEEPNFQPYEEYKARVKRAHENARALATPTKPEMQSVHPAAVSGKEEKQ